MTKFKSIFFCAFAGLSFVCALKAAPAVKNGDTITFLGDSITQFGIRPGGYVDLIVSALRTSKINVVPIYAGVSGNRSVDMLRRIDSGVLAKKPTIMLISCGVNDVAHFKIKRGIELADYRENMSEMIDRALKAGIKVYIMTPTMIKEDPAGAENTKLDTYIEALKVIAKEKKCPLIDVNAAMKNELAEWRKRVPAYEHDFLTLDGIHMNALGNVMMAKVVLEGLGFSAEEIVKAETVWDKSWWAYGDVIAMQGFLFKKLMLRSFQANKSLRVYINGLIQDDAKKGLDK
ncbi:MAG: GDSL-type esterase/lipase family protein [Kiritimatiellia bacterium]